MDRISRNLILSAAIALVIAAVFYILYSQPWVCYAGDADCDFTLAYVAIAVLIMLDIVLAVTLVRRKKR